MKISKKIFVLISLLLFSFMLLADAGIKFKEKEIDFGEVESGQTVDIRYEFENIGDQILIIKNVSTSCGCTATKLEKREYQPGEKGEIPTKFFTRGYNGRVIKTVTVTTNDPKNKHTLLKIKGEIKLTKFALIELLPNKLGFETVNLGEKYTQQITIKNPGTIELRIVELIHSPEISPQFLRKIIPAGEEAKIDIIFTPMEAGQFSSFLKMRTTAHKRPMSLIRINATVASDGTEKEPVKSKTNNDRK